MKIPHAGKDNTNDSHADNYNTKIPHTQKL